MNGRSFPLNPRVYLAWLIFAAGPFLNLMAQSQPEGTPGQAGQATSPATFNFSQLQQGEQQDGAPATTSPARPELRRSRTPRSERPPWLPPGQTPASAEATGALPFAAAGVPPSPATSASFQALPDDATAFAPDTQGAVGPNHLMVTLASQVRAQDRFGGPLQTMSLGTFWGVSGATNVYDPRVLYDRAAQRWIATAIANPGTNNSSLLIAVSQSSDPTGNWFRRVVPTDLGPSVFPDSPNVGLTRDWITVSANMYDKTNFNYFSCDIWVFNKANLYAGGAGQFTFFRYLQTRLGDAGVLVPLVNEDDGTTNMLVSNFDGNVSTEEGNFGYLRLFSITGPVGAEVFNDFGGPGGTNGNYVGIVTPWDSYSPYFDNFAPQKGTPNKVYIGDARIQSATYRGGFIYLSQHVFFPADAPTRTSIQWLSITPGGVIDQIGYLNDVTGVKSYAYPSLAVNVDGDVLIGFTSFSSNQFPTAAYAFHSYQDGGGALRQEAVLKSGETNFFLNDRGINHWGDWSATVVDPQNDTDLWTLQEYAAAEVAGTSRWGTWWGRVSPETDLTVTQAGPGSAFTGANVTYSVTVTNLSPTTATGVRIVDVLPPGALFVSASAPSGACGLTNGVVTCSLGHLASGATASATIVAQLSQTGANVITASGFGLDYDSANNTSLLQTTVTTAADLTVLMTSSPNLVTVSNTLTYQVTVTNQGPSIANSVQLSDTLPSGVTFLSAVPSLGTCSQSAGVVNCNLGNLSPGTAIGVQVQVRPNVGGWLTNRANVTGSSADPIPGNNSVSNTNRANFAPVMQAISNRTITEDSNLSPIEFTVGDQETPAASLNLTASSSNPALVPNGSILLGGAGSLRTISVLPLPNASGNVTITRTLTDADGGTNSQSFVLTITAVNDPPTLTRILDQTIAQNQVLGPIPFTIGDVETAASALTVSGASSNPALVPNANIQFSGTGFSRSLTVRPATNQVGTTTITVTVSDGTTTTNQSFLLTVGPVNAPPSITPIADQTINEDGSTAALPFALDDVDSPRNSLSVTAVSSDPVLVPQANILLASSGPNNRTVKVTPAPNRFGSVIITLRATDGQATNSRSFKVTIQPVNDPPVLGTIAAQAVDEDRLLTVPFYASDLETPPNQLRFTASSSNQGLLDSSGIAFSGNGTNRLLFLTPRPDASGSTTTITVTATDAEGLAKSVAFELYVRPIEDGPRLQIVLRNTGASRQAVLSWPVSGGSGWTLQSSPNQGASASWTTVAFTPVVVGTFYTVTVTQSAQASYFRLRR
jgi:uncharacterized repeat protein (TIGR01451 family)